MDITVWDILATIGLVIISYAMGYYYGKRLSSSPRSRPQKVGWYFSNKKNNNPYYDKKTNTYSVPTGGSLEGMPYPSHMDNK